MSNFVADAPTVWVENAFATSFEKAGYEITRVDSVAAANATTDPLAKAIPDINSRLIAASGG